MSFSARTSTDLIRIAAAGGGYKLDASARPTADLVRIAAAASQSGASIYFSGMSNRSTADLIRIGAASKGCVVMED